MIVDVSSDRVASPLNFTKKIMMYLRIKLRIMISTLENH
jgi:hypothetical protein